MSLPVTAEPIRTPPSWSQLEKGEVDPTQTGPIFCVIDAGSKMSGTANSHRFCQRKKRPTRRNLTDANMRDKKRNYNVPGAHDFSWTYNPKEVDCITCKPKNPKWIQTSKKKKAGKLGLQFCLCVFPFTAFTLQFHLFSPLWLLLFGLSITSNSLWPHGLWPTRLLCPWDFPGKNTGVGCYFLLQGNLPNPGIEPLVSPAFTGRFFSTVPPGKPSV